MFTSEGLIDLKGRRRLPRDRGSILIIVLKNNKLMFAKLEPANWYRLFMVYSGITTLDLHRNPFASVSFNSGVTTLDRQRHPFASVSFYSGDTTLDLHRCEALVVSFSRGNNHL